MGQRAREAARQRRPLYRGAQSPGSLCPSLGRHVSPQFQTVSGLNYTVQQNTNLSAANWITFTNFIGNGSLTQFTKPTAYPARLFFRLLVNTVATNPLVLFPLVSGTTFRLSFQTVSGLNYTVQQKTNLSDLNWITYTSFIGNGALTQFAKPLLIQRSYFSA